ncbi:aminotransferase class I/II-fold pyridoxal phosphate-dependent enzyme [Fodinicola feengrottensis]|uniref:Aminotransferase class I/II-fold pyridoxal phosphate-dependent enzyme n=1 Tax=Fodinicola feengrottensis TaxID=435914 RepID=A0ABP4TN04_9ACTN
MVDSASTHRIATISVHAGNGIDRETGAIRRPLVMANSYALPADPSELNWSNTDQLFYARNSNANQLYLQSKLAALEGAADAVVMATGVAALHGMFFTLLNTGDHIVCSDVTYLAVYRLLTELLPTKYGISTTLVDSSDPDAVRDAIRPETKLVHIETPANPTTQLTDIEAVADIAHRAGALLSVDSTFATPILQRPLNLGADLVVHSLTKYINGHGDAMGGSVAGSTELIDRIRNECLVNVGGAISPFNAWLIMRGSVTLPMRMRQHCKNALHIARFLEGHPAVAYVRYPGLPTHPQHSLANRQLNGGFGGMLAFGLCGDADAHNRFVADLRIITSAVSLGHDESLIVYVAGNDERAHLYPEPFRKWGHLRFSAGIEDPHDLIDDLSQALAKTQPPTTQ